MGSESKVGQQRDPHSSFQLAERAAYWTLIKKSEDVLLLDLRARSDVCDFFVICTGRSDMQVRAIAKAIREGLADEGLTPLHVEGLRESRWVLLDYVDVVVHVFLPEARQYYLLERLWGDAPRIEIDDAYFGTDEVRGRHPELTGLFSGDQSPPPTPSDES
jgi:ribosome-associated protein